MKKEIHPKYVECKVTCGCGNSFTTRSTLAALSVEVCSSCHPFFTGQQKFIDTAGRVEKFQRKYAWSAQQAVAKAEEAAKKVPAKPKRKALPSSTELHTTSVKVKGPAKAAEAAAKAEGGMGGGGRGGMGGGGRGGPGGAGGGGRGGPGGPGGAGGGGRGGRGGGRGGRGKKEAPVSSERLRSKPRPVEEPKAPQTQAETPKTEEPKAETPKAEEPKAETPKAEEPKAETPKAEEPKAETPKTETPMGDAQP
jgi:large subunit ribosomal protein L31